MPKRLFRSGLPALHDLFMAGLSFPLAFYLRWGVDFLKHTSGYLTIAWPLFILTFALISIRFRLYRSVWRYVSMREVLSILLAGGLTIVFFYAGWFSLNRLEMVPRSIPLLHGMVLVALLTGPRLVYRTFFDAAANRATQRAGRAIPVLLIGAGDHAEQFLRALQRMPGAAYRVVGIVDPTEAQRGRELHGIKVFGTLMDIPQVAAKLERRGERPQRLLLSEDYLDSETVSSLLDVSDRLAMPLARLPGLTDFRDELGGSIPIRPVQIEDLLGRPQNVHDRDGMRRMIDGRVVLVTGAGGSIGSELCRQIARLAPSQLVLYDHSEYLLYEIDREMGEKFAAIPRRPILGDVRDATHLERVCRQHRPALVIHAAAIKHVPLAEDNVVEAVRTNVFGTRHALQAARAGGAEDFLLISTDKAVNPANVMGACKRLAERVTRMVTEAGPPIRVTTVRFGNVLGSRGSVVPLFQQQLQAGGPLTVTHPDIERYFMTIREAVELVLQAAALHRGDGTSDSRVYVLDMGKPVKIADLARQMIRLAGLKPEEDIAIVYSGLRPGEKMYEELFYNAEELAKTAHASILLAAQADAMPADFAATLSRLQAACEAGDDAAALAALKVLVPEYQSAAEPSSREGEKVA
jgi:O-antigen biosynthesis protein WbqV